MAADKFVFGLDREAKKATLYNNGTQKFNLTTWLTTASAIVGILRSPAQYANKEVYIHDWYTTQLEVLSIVEAELGVPLERTRLDLAKVGDQSLAGLRREERTLENIYGALRYAVWGEEGAADWDEKDDSSVALGLPRKDLKAQIKKKMAEVLQL